MSIVKLGVNDEDNTQIWLAGTPKIHLTDQQKFESRWMHMQRFLYDTSTLENYVDITDVQCVQILYSESDSENVCNI